MKFPKVIKVPVVYLMVFCCILSLSDGQENEQGNVPDNPSAETAQFHKDRSQERRHLLAHLADRMDLDGEGLRHIQKHMGELTGDSTDNNKDIQDVADGDNVKGIFYFFKLHDYDNNQKLDGLEWMKALTDFHQDDKEKGKDFQAGGAMFLEHEAEAIVDELLKKHDANDDGMIDFIELMNSRVESLMTDLDKPQPDDQGGAHEEGHQEQNQESLENEYNQQQQGQDSPSLQEEYNQQQHQEQGNDDQQQQQQQQQQHDSEQPQEQQQQQQGNDQQENQQNSDQPQEDQSLEQEFNQQHQQQDSEQQQENDQQENQQDSEQPHEPSLEEEYNQQQH